MTKKTENTEIQPLEADNLQPYVPPAKWNGLPQPVIEQLRTYEIYIKSKMLPSHIQEPEHALVIAVTGKELGIPAMMAFKHLFMVGGTPSADGIILQALILRNGISWKTIEDYELDPDNDGMMRGFVNRRTTVEFTNARNNMVERGTFTKKRAVQTVAVEKTGQKLIDKFNYQNWLPEMLWWRAFTIGARRIAGGLMSGIRFADEVEGLIVGSEGNVLTEREVKALTARPEGSGPLKSAAPGQDIIIQPVDTPSKEEQEAKELLTKNIDKENGKE